MRVAATEQVLRLVESTNEARLDHRRYTPAIDAVRTQQAYLDAARRAKHRRVEDDVVLEAWQVALDNQEDIRDPSAGTSDWYLRGHLGASITNLRPVSPELATLNVTASSIISPAQIEEAADHPPQTTRARLRGEFIRQAKERRRSYTVDWIHLKLNDQANRTLLCWDPLDANYERAQQLIASMADTLT